jgi:hypothetical protein
MSRQIPAQTGVTKIRFLKKFMTTKTLFLVLFLIIGQSLSLFSIDHPITPVAPNGSGTENDPHLVESLANLYWIAVETRSGNSFENAFFLQTQDLDAGETVGWFEGEEGWMPVGLWPDFPFSGTYDGGGHTISSIHINRLDVYDVSFFGYVAGATISNLGLMDVSIIGEEYVGGITGEADNSTISNCFVSGSVEGTLYIGGISGALNMAEINNSYNVSHLAGRRYIGGIAGDSWEANDRIVNSYSSGSIHVLQDVAKSVTDPQKESSNPRTTRHILRDRHSKVDQSDIGGVIGYLATNATITNCFWDVDKDGIDGTASGDDNYGATGKTTEEMMIPETYSAWGADILEDENIIKGYPFLAWELGGNGEKSGHVWIIGTGTGDPVAVPLSDTAVYLSFLLIGGIVFFRLYRMS